MARYDDDDEYVDEYADEEETHDWQGRTLNVGNTKVWNTKENTMIRCKVSKSRIYLIEEKIHNIKLWRNGTNVSLKEAKDIIESMATGPIWVELDSDAIRHLRADGFTVVTETEVMPDLAQQFQDLEVSITSTVTVKYEQKSRELTVTEDAEGYYHVTCKEPDRDNLIIARETLFALYQAVAQLERTKKV